MASRIEWTDETWPILAGCEWVSPGCNWCYAARDALGRLAHLPTYAGLAVRAVGGNARFTGEVRLRHDQLLTPLGWRRPRRVFVASQSDLFHPDVPTDYIAQVWAVMAMAPRHTFQVLTKRPNRAAQLTTRGDFQAEVRRMMDDLVRDHGRRYRLAPTTLRWPLPNVHVGTSIEGPDQAWRMMPLARVDAAVRWLSVEPLIDGPWRVTDSAVSPGLASSLMDARVGWVVVGAESGWHARPMDLAWARQWRDACRMAGVPLFVKQISDPTAPLRVCKDLDQFPADLRIREYPDTNPIPLEAP